MVTLHATSDGQWAKLMAHFLSVRCSPKPLLFVPGASAGMKTRRRKS
jgi:hypothetical protein